MAGSTRLFQQAGSPLIQGRSRHERSFLLDWAVACLIAGIAIYGFHAAATLFGGTRPDPSSLDASLQWLVAPVLGLAAMLPTCAFAVWVGRRLGWREAWIGGAVLGGLVGIIVLL